jgi:RNA polymerase sigma-70 factor (ECF subfamily)
MTEGRASGASALATASDDTDPMNAFRDSVESMIPALRRYARALARDADIADDLVQDTLVRALRSERLFLGGDLRSWLYTILTNLNRNRRRSLARKPVFTELYDINADASGTEAEGRDIARALAALVEEQRSVLLLVMLEGLSYREVAEIQGVPIGTVMSRLARARAHVKAYLDGARPALRAVK